MKLIHQCMFSLFSYTFHVLVLGNHRGLSQHDVCVCMCVSVLSLSVPSAAALLSNHLSKICIPLQFLWRKEYFHPILMENSRFLFLIVAFRIP